MPATDDCVTCMREWIEALNDADRTRCEGAWCADAVWRNHASGSVWNGPAEITRQLWLWHAAFPDLRLDLTDSFSAGDRGALEVGWSGTYSGHVETPDGSIVPTGRQIRWSTCYLFDTQDGRVVEVREFFDPNSLLPRPAGFPKLASVEIREYTTAGRSSAVRSSMRPFFPALATIDMSSRFPTLAGVSWDEGDYAPPPRSRDPVPTTFPDVARCRW